MSITKLIDDAVRQAAQLIAEKSESRHIIGGKSNRDILVSADMESHRCILETLKKAYPHIAVISEENYDGGSVPDECFIIDPLDGTINFSRGFDEFGISIAYKNGSVKAGAVYKPLKNELFIAEKNKGAYLNGSPLLVSKIKRLNEAVVAIDGAREENKYPRYIDTVHSNARAIRSYGCAVQTLGYVARGMVDAYVFDKAKIWDIAAMSVIIEEAGGACLDQKGNAWQGEEKIAFGNVDICRQLISLISGNG